MIKKLVLIAILCILKTSCSSVDSSNYELDRRSGLEVYSGSNKDEDEKKIIRVERGLKEEKYKDMPRRVPALIEKVWVYDQQLEGGHWLNGSYLYIKVKESSFAK